MQERKISDTKKLFTRQLLFLLVLPVLILPYDITAAFSGFLGGLLAMMSSLIMSLMIFRRYRAQEPGKIVARIYRAEIVKIMITISGFVLIILTVKPLNFMVLIMVYFIIQVFPVFFLKSGR